MWIGAGLCAQGALAAPEFPAKLVEVRVGQHADYTRVVIETDVPVTGEAVEAFGELMVRVKVEATAQQLPVRSLLVDRVQVKPDLSGAAVSVGLKQDVDVKKMVLKNPPRLVFDLTPAKPGSAAAAAAAPKAAARQPAREAAKPATATKPPATAEAAKRPATGDAARESATAGQQAAGAAATTAAAKGPGAEGRAAERAAQTAGSDPASGAAARPAAEGTAPTVPSTAETARRPAAGPAADAAAADAGRAAQRKPKAGKQRAPESLGHPEAGSAERAAAERRAKQAAEAATPGAERRPAAPQAAAEHGGGLISLLMSPMGLAGLAGLVALVGGLMFVRRRGEPIPEPSPFASDEPFALEPAPGTAQEGSLPEPAESGFAAPPGLGSDAVPPGEGEGESEGQASIFDVPEDAVPDEHKEEDLAPVPVASGFEASALAGQTSSSMEPAGEEAVEESVMQLVQDLERRMAQMESRVEDLSETKERLERQVAAQTEELRVQRAAIARTQRVLRTVARPEDEPSEPTPKL